MSSERFTYVKVEDKYVSFFFNDRVSVCIYDVVTISRIKCSADLKRIYACTSLIAN